jgi:S1-C subfamily serine protease
MMRENESDPGDPPDVGGAAPGWGNWMPPSAYGSAGWEPAAPYQPPPRHGRRLLVYLVVAAAAAGLGAGVTFAISRPGVSSSSAGVSSHDIPAQHDNPAAAAEGLNQARVEKKVRPGLVDITATLQYSSETAEGTGMILSAGGLVLTNNHVIDNSTSVKATLVSSGRTYRVKVLGYDSTQDVALLQLEGAVDLPVVTLGNSSQISIGMPVLALGNAQGRGGVTPAPGIINALGRSINASDSGSGITEYLHDMEQTSAQIQQGDSGGALADNSGQVVGMITAANTTSGQAGGTIGFAIPINTALSIAREIVAGQSSSAIYLGQPGFLGVAAATSTSSDPKKEASDEQGVLEHGGFDSNPDGIGGSGCIQSELQVTAPTDIAPAQSGALVVGVFCDTAVSATGLISGDVITAVNGQPVTTPASLGTLVEQYHPGDAVSVSWTSVNGGKHTASIALGAGPVR